MTEDSVKPDADPQGDETRQSEGNLPGGEIVGPYHLLRLIGEGGMGEVWLAQQRHPIRRQVALKVIKAGMDTRQVIARFEAERQALALMDHPTIATVFDGGATPQGRPYFAMEYVKGEPITTYCDRHRLATRERLSLFMQVCDGVLHAHQKGVIHRDLKPSNVLVTILDDRPLPKIIDFGVAKATAQPLTDRSAFTELGMVIGTLEYMSPEQAEMTGLNIDTRTDVYALGVILYELLTGALPFDRRELGQAGLAEVQRIIREKEPSRPSTRVTQHGSVSTEAAANRRTEPHSLAHQLRGDLDCVTMKALEKDRTRRYNSPSDLAADVRRYLANEPVLARPSSAAYRARKFARRHRLGVAVGAAALLLLLAFSATVMLQSRRIGRERDRANREAQISKQVTEFLTNLFDVSDPGRSRGKSVTARELLDAGARQISSAMPDDAELQARMMETIGITYDRLGLFEEAQAQLERALQVRRQALGPEAPETLGTMTALASTLVRRGQYQAALTIYQQVLEIQRRTLGAEHPDRLAVMQDVGWLVAQGGKREEGEKLISDALEIERRTLGNTHPVTLKGINRLANVMYWQGRYADQEKLLREELEIRRRVQGPDHPNTLAAARSLAGAVGDQGRLEESAALLRETLEITRRVLGPDHVNTAKVMNDLALTVAAQKHLPEAEQLYVNAIEIYRKTLGPEGDDTLLAMNNLAIVYLDDHRAREAAVVLGPNFWKSHDAFAGLNIERTLMIMNNLALAHAVVGKHDDATRLARETIAAMRRTLGEKHPYTATAILTFAEIMALRGDYEQALRLVKEAIDHGYRDADQIASDEYLKHLRDDPRFRALIAEVRELAQSKK